TDTGQCARARRPAQQRGVLSNQLVHSEACRPVGGERSENVANHLITETHANLVVHPPTGLASEGDLAARVGHSARSMCGKNRADATEDREDTAAPRNPRSAENPHAGLSSRGLRGAPLRRRSGGAIPRQRASMLGRRLAPMLRRVASRRCPALPASETWSRALSARAETTRPDRGRGRGRAGSRSGGAVRIARFRGWWWF